MSLPQRLTLSLAVLSVLSCATRSATADDGFRSIFDGDSLESWISPDMRYWTVEDGAITGRSSAEVPCTKNQFLVWQGGTLDDFELRFEYRITASPQANSGVQIRSAIAEDGHAVGYQADLDAAGRWRGALYDEHTGRALLAAPGTRTRIAKDGTRTKEALPGDPPAVDAAGWNRYHIEARGSRIRIRVNDVLTSDVTDDQEGERDLWGRLAFQLHSGPPMTVQFRNIGLKRLPLSDGRKKVVLIAGRPSHASGEHEFNAGIRLLTKRLRKVEGIIAANYHDNGWPKDPSAFDNADAIVLYADGGGGHPFNRHLETLDGLVARGTGILCMHYGVEVPKGESGDRFKKWIGGFYESGWSSNPHWDAELDVTKDHAIGRGVKAAKIRDEWYFAIRFRDDEKSVTPILSAKPSDKTRSRNGYPPKPYPHIIKDSGKVETLMWAVERDDGGRGVGFTGGHWHRNWAFDSQRRAILNAMVWVAGGKVPEGGVDSEPVTEKELNSGLDRKREMRHVNVPEGAK